jgi:molecular chaperone DnaK
MIEDAEKHADEDKRKRLFTEAVNQAEILLYSTEQTLRDFAERFSARDLEEIHNAIADVRVARNADDKDVDAINGATARLQTVMHRFAELMYSAPDSGQYN